MRRRLTLLVAATTSVVLIAFLIPVAVLTGDVAQSGALRRALAQSQSIVAVAGTGDVDAVRAAVSQVQSDGLTVTVFRADGSVLGTPYPRTSLVAAAATSASASVTSDKQGGRVILQPVFGEGGTQVVRVAIPPGQLNRGVGRARTILVLLAVVLFAGCVLVADMLARSLTRPLAAVGEAAQRLADGDLEVRVTPEGTQETREIARAMNHLASRIGALLTAEREAVADLSHRLRTPITVLRLDAEALSDGAERSRIAGDVDDLTRQVDAVIREARRTERADSGATADVAEVVRERVELWQALADDEGRRVEQEIPDRPLVARVAPTDLGAAVDALLGNVMTHTPQQAAFRVQVEPTEDGLVRVVVEDAGPGLPHVGAAQRGRSTAGSTGLGLDIARRTAEASGGAFEVGRSERLGGARVVMLLGPPER